MGNRFEGRALAGRRPPYAYYLAYRAAYIYAIRGDQRAARVTAQIHDQRRVAFRNARFDRAAIAYEEKIFSRVSPGTTTR